MNIRKHHYPDYNLLSPDDLNAILKRPIEYAIGEKEVQRLNRIMSYYDYYDGKQHKDALGRFVSANELERPDGMAYDPTRFSTNYFKAFIKRKARWQMAGDHGVSVKPKSQSQSDVDLAKNHQELVNQLWKDNKFTSKKIRIARDRLIAGMIACKLVFNERTGKLHWIWHKATEVFPMYSRDGFNDLIGVDIIVPQEDEDDENKTNYWKQSFRLTEDYSDCILNEALYDENLELIETYIKDQSLGLDFVPLILFEVSDLATRESYNDEIEDMITLTQRLNSMMEDATDALKFEMFNLLVVKNAREGTASQLRVAPGAVLEVKSDKDGVEADVDTIENHFQWKEAYKDQYNRIKSALHELAGLPQIVPQELNFGGLNDRALQVLYQDAIQETEEHWLSWQDAFKELHEKSVKYLQARSSKAKFAYDKDVVNRIEDYETEVNFVLPLPDDRDTLVDLLIKEIDGGLESLRGAQRRLGVENIEEKMAEILEERRERAESFDPYPKQMEGNNAEDSGGDGEGEDVKDET
ncbi:portal Gp-6 family-like protein [Bacillus phage Mgbh1]|uniref:Portal Gp-6 family-like protein n=1 Tax=Bacillus phage Mgbh1 TaxID=1796993 RepID=A0A142F1L7_9CAUD|nr:portal Gp-6 family-like protein [Bacillus phage Mgbh1]AMQ66674.1 portal Gp-6 family-like protein [Bacillus phage Mgbh1]